MALKDILVHVDDSPATPARLALAVSLAAAHGAHVTGLHVRYDELVPAFMVAEYGGAYVAELATQSAQRAAETAKALFDRAIAAADVPNEWRDVEGGIAATLALHARYADLAIVGQADPQVGDLGADAHIASDLVLDAGRPVLVVPYIGAPATVGSNILVAWNASREATRALNDAIPIFERAQRVTVLAVDPRGGPSGHGAVPGADISLHLARHGVNVVATIVVGSDVDVGDHLLNRASDEGADLIVMGAWGHRRFSELMLGGATRHIMRHMTVPVLFSH